MPARGPRRTPAVIAAFTLAAAVPAISAGPVAVAEVTHTDNIDRIDQDAFGYGTDLAFNGNLVAAGAGAWSEQARADSGVHILQRQRDGSLEPLSFLNCSAWHSDVDWVAQRYIVQSNDGGEDNSTCQPGKGAEGVRVIDAKNPRTPSSIGFAETRHGSHNLSTLGDTGLVYVSSYALGDPAAVDGISIVDVGADPVNPPVEFLEFPDADNDPSEPDMRNNSATPTTSPGCHDISFDLQHNPPLGFCAGITETMVWDVSDPRHPVIISTIRNPDVSIHHGARVNADGDVLLVQDEWLGAAGANSGCLAPNQPSGTIWFYDISDPRNPKPRGVWSAPKPDPASDFCTTHFFGTFTMNTDGRQRDMVVTSYYQHGIWVVDFTDPSAPKTHAYYEPDGANFWSAYPYRGTIYANSFAPATLTGTDPATANKGGVWSFKLDGYGPPQG